MQPTDIRNPDYFHKVVDCQWACPAHTPVPEYIRMIAAGRYSDAYLVNWKSNVFPGILGRTCDRPCEPACRRGRVEEENQPKPEPVAICRLKRVTADYKENDAVQKKISAHKKTTSNGKKVVCVGAGPASLTVARDLAPLGYEVTVYDQDPRAGGMIWSQIPRFRLPMEVIDEEVGYILNLGVTFKQRKVDSMKALMAEGWDAIFVGTGAPRGRDLDIPGRKEGAANIHIGIDWLASVSFGHRDKVGKKVIVLGGGNTAMDCCRSARRLGATDVKVIARKTRRYFKASPWELEDAEEEGVEIRENLQPVRFIIENVVLTGMEFERFRSEETPSGLKQEVIGREIIPCDAVVLAVGQDNAFPWIERNIGLEFGKWDMPVVDRKTFMSTRPGVFFGGDAAFGPANIIWAVEHGHQAAISIHNYCQGVPVAERPAHGMTLTSTKMGLHEWAYSNNYDPHQRQKMQHVDLPVRFASMTTEVEKGFTAEQTRVEVERCLNCDVETHFVDSLCIECDACVDICPVDCLTITAPADEPELRNRFPAPALNTEQPLFVSGPLKQTKRVMAKDENVCLHCGLCAERCPTYAWDMRKFVLQLPYAGHGLTIPMAAV